MLHLLNYLIFTFLLGVALLSTFTFWTYNIETATRERWNEGAIEANLDDIAEAIERADTYARNYDNGTYSEKSSVEIYRG